MSLTPEQYENKIKELEKEIVELKKRQTVQMKRQQYGLTWIDVPEAFDKESENKIPVLEEVKDKAISNDDGKPTHILIEGDNYHALQCLNYTHKGKVDVIYIDPPYNTGSDGFIYKDARYLEKYPDGTEIPKEHPLRHSAWLSFMKKRLQLAKQLLSEKGVIFISIDDNEQANLKILCDEIFGANNFVCNFIVTSAPAGTQSSNNVSEQHSYALCYAKKIQNINFVLRRSENEIKERYVEHDDGGNFYSERLWKRGVGGRKEDVPTLHFPVYYNPENSSILIDEEYTNQTGYVKIIPYQTVGVLGRWTWSKDKMRAERDLLLVKKVAGEFRLHKKIYESEESGKLPYSIIGADVGRTEIGGLEVKEIFAGKKIFSYPKPVDLIKLFLDMSSSKNSVILDFFAGSGTTLHSTIKLNAQDDGTRQCILIQTKETTYTLKDNIEIPKKDSEIAFGEGFKFIPQITYERNKRVIQGYTNSKGEQIPGLGNSLKYYKTAFVGNHDAVNATDDDCVTLAKKAGCLLSIGENTLDEIQSTDFFQIYEDKNSKLSTAIYFTEELSHFDEFVESVKKVASNHKTVIVYTFSWSSCEDFIYEFEGIPNVEIKAIPQPILEIYKSIYQK